jgi:hypothetical protein
LSLALAGLDPPYVSDLLVFSLSLRERARPVLSLSKG